MGKTTPLIMAPLRGVTDDALRDAFAKHFGGLDRAISPFLATIGRGGLRSSAILRACRAAAQASLPSTPQVLTADAADLLAVATRLCDAGCREVNWNLGCPHPPVVRRGRGAGLLRSPERVDAILDHVLPRSPAALSVKMRLGYERPEESLAVLEVLDRYPLTEVIIHARLGTQMYRGRVDLDAFGRCLEATRHPVIYNGDIVDLEGFHALEARFPSVAGWMIGRGALYDPDLPRKIRGLPCDDRAGRLRRFHDELYDEARARLSGPGHALGRMKGLWDYIGPASGVEGRQLKLLRKATTYSRYEALAAAALAR